MNPAASAFVPEASLPRARFELLTELRIHHPEYALREARRRRKRSQLAPSGKLVLAALDHPARGVTAIGGDALAMGDRYALLARARRVLDDPLLDGVVATSDVLEELLLLAALERSGARSFLDDRVLVGSMNRGGLDGSAFEMEDAFTSLSANRLAELRCEGGKMLCRIDPGDPASGRTVAWCADAISALARRKLAAFVEPLPVKRSAHGYEVQKDTESLVRLCGVASALGESSLHIWLKLPLADGLAHVGNATTLPILLLGGPARENPVEMLRDFARGLHASPRVRGAIIGRNVLFPGKADPLPVCRALTALVHTGAELEQALRLLDETRSGPSAGGG